MLWKILLFIVIAYIVYAIITVVRFKATGKCSSSCSSCAHSSSCSAAKKSEQMNKDKGK